MLLSQCLQVVFYYVSQSKANNHAVREAACAVIAELMDKVDRQAVSPHVPDLLRALLLCFKDSSWPVRDAACTACGRYELGKASILAGYVTGSLITVISPKTLPEAAQLCRHLTL